MRRLVKTGGTPGLVSLVGAGPGDPELLAYRAILRLQAADVVLYDGLVPPSVVRLAEHAEHVSVSKRAAHKTITQADVTGHMIRAARQGWQVVRLKAGDPFVLGRGGEEMLALAAAGIPFEIVPGVTSATAAPALAGIPVTHRGLASAFVVVSGHAPEGYAALLGALPPGSATIVVLMGVRERARVAACLMEAGWPAATPAAVVLGASRPTQRVWTGTLGTVGPSDVRAGDDPGVLVIGDVVSVSTDSAAAAARSFTVEERSWQSTTIPRL
jgi:uroporphyrin-III C-methyltransferase/precorrin-2 dehydrogenase/sirohydrochlorin ferrochelatase